MSLSAKLIEVTPAFAEELLLRNERNRHVHSARVGQYAADMRDGAWKLNGEAIKIADDGTLLDGQHRLMAVLEADVSVQMLVITGLPPEAQETMDQGRARSFGDVLHLRGEKDYFVLAASTRLVAAYERDGVPFAVRRGLSVPEQARTLERNPGLRDSVEYSGRRRRPWLSRGPASGLHYLFSIADQEGADDFFDRLASGANLNTGDPIYLIRERLIRDHQATDGRTSSERTKLALIIKAWNAYQDGDTPARLTFVPGGANPERFPSINGLHARGEVPA
ncbi:hypothetical protein [Paraconexibacter algicola]|uniref:Uncharacterized protein n=1 Tax=Paraconexibacter algicola TaxID=2133960 RepID=A0A2T4UE76_9ACTN|nr:hypothetical protein [Paraconexibacter algicola]PTL55775.1 hypothetical protein C7Y72_19290 [Paraconexibacter algicola]